MRPPVAEEAGTVDVALAASPQPFVDSRPVAETAEGGDAQGDRPRRRNRRGGRGGRDRDEGAGNGLAEAGSNPAPTDTATRTEPASDEAAFDRQQPTEGGERGEREGRGRGRGRDRDRPRGDRPAADPMTAPQGLGDGALAQAAASEVAAPIAASLQPAAEPAVAAAVTMPLSFAAAPAAIEPAPARPALPVAEPVAPAAVAPAFELPIDSLAAMAESAGLQWVNSDAEKIRAVQATLDNQPAPVRVPRERKPVARADEGPLVLVETRKDLSQYKLPFETAGQDHALRE